MQNNHELIGPLSRLPHRKHGACLGLLPVSFCSALWRFIFAPAVPAETQGSSQSSVLAYTLHANTGDNHARQRRIQL